jgi:D-alanyl-D-alanine carboxypeptidase
MQKSKLTLLTFTSFIIALAYAFSIPQNISANTYSNQNTYNPHDQSQIYSGNQIHQTSSTSLQTSSTSPQTLVINWPDIVAQSAYIYDPVGNRYIYEKNADQIHPMASLVKVMTAAVADDFMNMNPKIAEKTIRIDSRLEYNQADRLLPNGSVWLPENLIRYMMIGSSNKAADTLSRNIIPQISFISYMNFKAKQFGLENTTFFNATGLSIPSKDAGGPSNASGLTSAREMAQLLWKTVANHSHQLEVTRYSGVRFIDQGQNINIEIKNTNRSLVDNLPIRFGKTGYNEMAGGNLAVVLQRSETSHPFVIVIMGSTEQDRFTDLSKLAEIVLNNFEK